MPGRKSNLRGPRDEITRKTRQKQKSGRGLNALAIAENQFPSKSKIRQCRLGEGEDHSKRKRNNERGGDEHSEEPTKRRRTGHESSESDDNGGSDSEGHEWKIGQVNSDIDSDIDSDEALGSSDEERFEGFTFRGSSSRPKPKSKRTSSSTRRSEKIDLSENVVDQEGFSDDDSDDDLGEDAVDLATAWDMNAEDEIPETAPRDNQQNPKARSDTSDMDSNSNHDHDSDSSDDTDLSISDTEGVKEIQNGLSKLHNFKKLPRRGSRGQENSVPTEYGLTSTRKLIVADLIPSITDSRLKSSLKHLDSIVCSRKSKSSGIAGKLTAPPPKRQQDKLDRASAYEKSKETLARWIDTVKANRQADHLSFPLPEPNAQQARTIGPVKPQTDLESTIQTILVESGLAESNENSAEQRIQAAEELEVKKLSLEEARARTAELRKRRDLLFREEVRAKRIKKIKSKSYRRVHRKEREKLEQLEQQALAKAGVGLNEDERERYDRQRAEARVSAKHKESKWAKSLKQTGRTAWDEEARLGIVDIARKDEELRRRIEGKRVNTGDDEFLAPSSSDSDDDRDPWDEEDDSETEARRLRKDLDKLDDRNDGQDINGPHSKLLSMKFMQKAEATRRLQNDEEIKKLRREIDSDHSEPEETEGGRRKFGGSKADAPKQQVTSRSRSEFEEAPGSENEELNTSTTTFHDGYAMANDNKLQKSKQAPKPKNTQLVIETRDNDTEENPWLTQTSRNNRKRIGENADQTVDISLSEQDQVSTVGSKVTSYKRASHSQAAVDQPHHKNRDDHHSDSDDDFHAPVLLKNHDLVKKAFAGDDVVVDFEKEKLEAIEDEGDQVIDNTLPGWGSWTGSGISKKQQKRQKRFFTTIEGVKPEQRKDAKLSHVIINEKRVKSNKKYLATQLPHPFESKAQYERSLRIPIGPEWTTKETFQDATKPRVMIKQGIIKPMERPSI